MSAWSLSCFLENPVGLVYKVGGDGLCSVGGREKEEGLGRASPGVLPMAWDGHHSVTPTATSAFSTFCEGVGELGARQP